MADPGRWVAWIRQSERRRFLATWILAGLAAGVLFEATASFLPVLAPQLRAQRDVWNVVVAVASGCIIGGAEALVLAPYLRRPIWWAAAHFLGVLLTPVIAVVVIVPVLLLSEGLVPVLTPEGTILFAAAGGALLLVLGPGLPDVMKWLLILRRRGQRAWLYPLVGLAAPTVWLAGSIAVRGWDAYTRDMLDQHVAGLSQPPELDPSRLAAHVYSAIVAAITGAILARLFLAPSNAIDHTDG